MKVVFVGPSLPDCAQLVTQDIMVLPPAKCGDVHLAAQNGATHIGLIDGTFENGMSVWHKEIIYALEAGVFIAGASSMGALRAAECAAFGMKGIGKIFNDYHSGARNKDADVALIFAPQELGYQPLSVTLVDFEATVASLLQTAKIHPAMASKLLAAAARLFYKRRTLQAILEEAVGEVDTVLQKLLTNNWVDQKRMDALALLNWLKKC
jgi:hypothetical protein